jgi:hypothetical protein
MSLDALKQALAARLADHPEVKLGSLQAQSEFVTLTVEPAHSAHRFLRAALADLGAPVPAPVFFLRWAAYRAPAERDNGEGSAVGDLAFTLRAVDHWIIEGMPWHEVPEFRAEPTEPAV